MGKKYLSFDELMSECNGKWHIILPALASDPKAMRELIDKRRYWECPLEHPSERKGKHRCKCNDNFDSTGGIHCLGLGCDFFSTGFGVLIRDLRRPYPEVAELVCGVLGISGKQGAGVIQVAQKLPSPLPPQQPVRTPNAEDKEDDDPTSEQIRTLARECYSLFDPASEPLRRYLRNRGLSGLDWKAFPTILYHPHLQYYDKERKTFGGRYGAMVACIQGPDGRLVGIHITCITEDGRKAPVKVVKRMIKARGCTLVGAAVRLGEAGLMLGASEGIENGFAAVLARGLPVWVALSTSGLASLELPRIVRHLIIWGDRDRLHFRNDGTVFEPGRDAAEALQTRMLLEGLAVDVLLPGEELEGRTVYLLLPDGELLVRKGIDWADIALNYGLEHFPLLPAYRPGHVRFLSSYP